jgi:hypothetical protein
MRLSRRGRDEPDPVMRERVAALAKFLASRGDMPDLGPAGYVPADVVLSAVRAVLAQSADGKAAGLALIRGCRILGGEVDAVERAAELASRELGAKVSEVAEAAGITERAVYMHFPDENRRLPN